MKSSPNRSQNHSLRAVLILALAIATWVFCAGCAPKSSADSGIPDEGDQAVLRLAKTEHDLATMGMPMLTWNPIHLQIFESFLDRAASQVTLVKKTYGRDKVAFLGATATEEIHRRLGELRTRLNQTREEFRRNEDDRLYYERLLEIQKILSNDLGRFTEIGPPQSTWTEVQIDAFVVVLRRLEKEDSLMNAKRAEQGLEPWPASSVSARLWEAIEKAYTEHLKAPVGGS